MLGRGGVLVPFSLPTFILPVDVYSGPFLFRVFRFQTLGNLALGRRAYPTDVVAGSPSVGSWVPQTVPLLLPKLTDVRDRSVTPTPDMVEVPSGSGRWYVVVSVEDAGKGFANEHRVAYLLKASSAYGGVSAMDFAGMVWPSPIP